MGLFDQFPYTNFHELNLMWNLEALKEIQTTTEQFVAINSLKYADPIQWNIVQQYEKNTIVIDPLTGTAYISVQPVPSGVALTNTDYWTVVFDLGSFVTRAAKNFTERWEEATTLTATFPTLAGEWLVWGDTLYIANVNITAGDSYIVDGNIRRITIEEVKNEIYTTFNTMIGDLADLNTTDKSNLVAAINEVLTTLISTSGDLADLSTTDKSNLVAAINEVLTTLANTSGDLADLDTTDKSNLVAAINEIVSIIENLNVVKSYRLIMPHLSNNAGNDVTIQLIELDGEYIAIDSCKTAYRAALDTYLTDLLGNKKLKAYIITHFHGDHANCSDLIINKYCDSNTLFILPMAADLSQFSEYLTDLQINYNAVMQAFSDNGYSYSIPNNLETITLLDGNLYATCYNYDTANLQTYYDSGIYNNCSASFRFYNNSGSLYVSGDTDIIAQSLIAKDMQKSDVALIPHHNVNFCGDANYHINIDANFWIASYQITLSEFPRYIYKLFNQITGFRPIYDISEDLEILFNGSVSIIKGSNREITNFANVYKIIAVYPLAIDNDNIIRDYKLYSSWTLDHLALLSVADKEKRTFEIFSSSTYAYYYQTIINELTAALGGTSWIIDIGGGILECRLYSNDNGRRLLKYCSGTGVVTRYSSINEFPSTEWSTINDTVGGNTHAVHQWAAPALLGCNVAIGTGTVEVLLYNTKRTATYHGYATYGGGDTIYVNVTISNNVLTINACKRTASDGTTTDLNLIDIGPVW